MKVLQISAFVIFSLSSLLVSEGKQLDFLDSEKTAVDIKDFNFYAVVSPAGHYDLYCGSTLISPTFLISAYHCIKFISLEAKWIARFEVQNKCDPDSGWKVKVTRLLYHGDAITNATTVKNDIAVLKLANEVTKILPAVLPRVGLTPGEVGVVIGYEAMRPRDHSKEGILKELSSAHEHHQHKCPLMKKLQMIQMKDACEYEGSQNDSEGLYCSYNPPESFADCRFDSGAPWFHETRPGYRILIGVSTFGSFYCNPKGINGLYTDVYVYRDWIEKVLRGYEGGYIRAISYDSGDDDNSDDEDNGDDDSDNDDDDYDGSNEEYDDNFDNDDDDNGDDDDVFEVDNDHNYEDDDDDNDEYDDDNWDDSGEDDDANDDDDDDDDDENDDDDDHDDNDDDFASEEEGYDSNDGDMGDDDFDDDDYHDRAGDDDNAYDHDYDEDDDNSDNGWVPSGSPYVIGPDFT